MKKIVSFYDSYMYAHQISAKGWVNLLYISTRPPSLPSTSQKRAAGVLDELGKGECSVTCINFMRNGA